MKVLFVTNKAHTVICLITLALVKIIRENLSYWR